MKMTFSESPIRPYHPRHRRPVLRLSTEKLALVAATAIKRRTAPAAQISSGPDSAPADSPGQAD
jgi:hypothetical protein